MMSECKPPSQGLEDWNGEMTYSYKACDQESCTGEGKMTITVLPVNDAPVAQAVEYDIDEDTSLTLPPLGSDVDSDVLTTEINSTTVYGWNSVLAGEFTKNDAGQWVFQPELNFHGTVHVSYQVSDGNAVSNRTSMTINVGGVNDRPLAVDVSVSGDEDSVITGNVSASDADNDPITYELISLEWLAPGLDGTTVSILYDPPSVTLAPDGSFSYTPNENWSGTYTFQYKACDNYSACSTSKTVSITVNPVNDAPTVPANSVATKEDTREKLEPKLIEYLRRKEAKLHQYQQGV